MRRTFLRSPMARTILSPVMTRPKPRRKRFAKPTREALTVLGEQGVQSVLLEGGSALLGAMLNKKLVDRVVVFVAPKIVGGIGALSPVGGNGADTMQDALGLHDVVTGRMDTDVMIDGRISTWDWGAR